MSNPLVIRSQIGRHANGPSTQQLERINADVSANVNRRVLVSEAGGLTIQVDLELAPAGVAVGRL